MFGRFWETVFGFVFKIAFNVVLHLKSLFYKSVSESSLLYGEPKKNEKNNSFKIVIHTSFNLDQIAIIHISLSVANPPSITQVDEALITFLKVEDSIPTPLLLNSIQKKKNLYQLNNSNGMICVVQQKNIQVK